jgi:hypothetical protein
MNIAPEYATVALLAVVIFFGLLSPVLCALYLATFKGRGVSGRWLFLIFGPAFSYGLVWVGTIVFYLPFYLAALFLVPALRELGHKSPFWVPIIDWVLKYDLLIVCGALIALSLWLVLYLWPRWPSLLAAMANPAVKRDANLRR